MRRRLTAMLAIGGLTMVFLAGCSSDDSGGSSGSDTTASDSGGVTAPTDTGTPVAVEAGDTSETEQYLTPAPDTVAAGPTTFTLTNAGNREHEMVVLKTDTPFDQLEINGEGKVSEDDSVGEVPETSEGESGSFTVDLEPGAYVLVCNIADHYEQGMRAAFTVTG